MTTSLRILVIEHELGHIESAKLTLANHQLTLATTVQEAMRILADRQQTFDVVLTCLHMPIGDSTDHLEVGPIFALKAIDREMRVIIVSEKLFREDPRSRVWNLLTGDSLHRYDRVDFAGFHPCWHLEWDGSALVKTQDQAKRPVRDWLKSIAHSWFFPQINEEFLKRCAME